jgi:integral membrane protein
MTILDNFFAKYPEEKILHWFKKICLAEAISWFFLFTAMFLIREKPEELFSTIYIILIGNIHGFFFSLYLLLLYSVRKTYQWDDEDFLFALIAAFFPFATIWIDKKLARFDRE